MCRFKSGIILKNKIVVSQGANDSHSDLLEELGIKDDYLGATKTFVRAELTPKNDEWWTNPATWEFNVDQDITPEWFSEDKEKYEKEFREAVMEWWNVHVLIDQKIDKLKSGYYRLKRCEVKELCNDVQVILDSSTVKEMYDSSTVQEMYGSSTVQRMYDSSTVQRMYDSSTVKEMYGSSTVKRMYYSSTVKEMHGSSTVQSMYDSSTVQKMYDSSIIARDKEDNIHTAQSSNAEIVRHENK